MQLTIDTERLRLRRVRQRVRTFVDLAGDKGQSGGIKGSWAMVTLTYAPEFEWEPNHIKSYLQAVRKWARRRGFALSYVWVCELQRRGVPHYHVLVKLPKGLTLPKPDKQGHWKWGMSEVDWVRKSGKRYLSKYLSKDTARGQFPKGCRLCGGGGLPKDLRRWWSWSMLPRWARQEVDPGDMPCRERGGIRSKQGFLPSPWVAMPILGTKQVSIRRMSVDQWVGRAASDAFPHETFLMRSAAARTVQSYCDVRWQFAGEHWRNPFSRDLVPLVDHPAYKPEFDFTPTPARVAQAAYDRWASVVIEEPA